MQRALIRARDLLATRHVNQFRSSVTTQSNIWATAVTLDSKTKALEIKFNTGEEFRYPAELLRVVSPAANAVHGHSFSPNKNPSTLPPVVQGRRHVNILEVEPVGRYALRIQFDDLHGYGIYSWSFLHELGVEKLKRIRQYLKALKEQGLSRDPKPLSKKRGSAQKQEPAEEDAQDNKVNATALPDDADLAEQPPVDPGLLSSKDKIKDEPAITTSNKNRQQRQVEPQLFQNLPLKRTRQQAAAEEAVKKLEKKAAKEAVAAPEYMDYEDGLDDDGLADAGELENEKKDVDYHPSSAKQQPHPYLFRNKQKQRSTNSKQQDGYGSADSTPPPKRYAKKKPKKNNRATAAAAGSRKLALGGGGHGGYGAGSGVEDAATAMAGSDVADKPPSLADQVQYLLNHTAKLEERLSHQEKEIASLNSVALALSHTVRSMQQQEQQQQQQQQQPIANYNTTTTTRGTNGGNFSNRNGTGNGNSFLPPPTQREVQIVQSIQKLDADNRACAASLNNHSKTIVTITQQVNSTNQNIRHLSNVAVQLKEAYRNLDHHVLTQKAGLAGCQNDIRDIKNFLYEYKTEMKKKADEAAVKVAGAVRPHSWDLSPRLL